MSTAEGGDIVELTTKQVLVSRGAANAVVDLVDDPGMEIDDQFDPIRRDHLAAAGETLAEAQDNLTVGGTFRGRFEAVEQQALRDALGAVEAMLTPPLSERIGAVGYRAADDELDVLSAALNGVPAPDREDLAFADFRYGGYDAALRRRTDFEELAESVLSILREDQLTPDDVLDRLTGRTFPPGASCSNFDLVIVDLAANVAILAGAPAQRRSEGISRFNETLDDALTAGARCYRKMDDRRIRAGAARLTEAIDRGDRSAARTHALGVAEMVAWAQSNRLREERIGLR